MKVDYVTPFNKAVFDAFSTMAGIEVKRRKPFIKKGTDIPGQIAGVLGLAGENMSGSIALIFPTASILNIYEKLIGVKADSLDDDVQDAVGEFANLVGGGAKAGFTELGLTYQVSIPLVITGPDFSIVHRNENPIIVIPFEWGSNTFSLEISVRLGVAKASNVKSNWK